MKKVCVHAITRHKVKVGDGNFGITFSVIVRYAISNIIEIGPADWGFATWFLSHGMVD
jgi:hypothetical protein